MAHLNPTPVLEPGQDRTMILNMGPQHPSTHGVLRVILEIDGETVVRMMPDIGFLHTGIEKTCEAKFYQQVVPLTDRIDYLCPMTNNLCYVLAVEKSLGLEIPPKAQWLRVLLNELTRINSHLVWLGTHAMDIGALTVFLYCFREREEILKMFEMVSGQRMMTSYFRVGGIALEPPLGFFDRVRDFAGYFPSKVDEYENLLTGNPIWGMRTKGVARMTAEDAIALGASGPTLRGSGVDIDLRRDMPYSNRAARPREDEDADGSAHLPLQDHHRRICGAGGRGLSGSGITARGNGLLHRERRHGQALPRAHAGGLLGKSADPSQNVRGTAAGGCGRCDRVHRYRAGRDRPVKFSEEFETRFAEMVPHYPTKRSALVPTLLYAQDETGFLSDEVILEIATRLDLTELEVRNVISYYSMLTTKPRGKFNVQVCTNISCMVRGAEEILEHCSKKLGVGHKQTTPDGLFTLEEVECIGACSWAPAAQVNYDFHENLTTEKMDRILEDYKKETTQ